MKKIFRSAICLPIISTLIITVSAGILLIIVLGGHENTPLAYFTYLYSTYASFVGISGLIRFFSWLVPRIKERLLHSAMVRSLKRVAFFRRYLEEPLFRAEISIYVGLFINLVYVVLRVFSGIHFRSVWMITLGVYYLVLAILRYSLVEYLRRHRTLEDIAAEYRRYRFCAGLLFAMNIVLAGIVILIVNDHEGYDYPGILIYAMAAYIFYYFITAVINLIKYRKSGSPVISASKVVVLTCAMVSVLSLETAMIDRFGGADSGFRYIMTAITGIVIFAVVFGMAVVMTVKAGIKLKENV